ncbi:MAG: molybdenum cofactor biosysynthesis protein [Pelagibacterium sp. SCN 64-44]|nr:MAG: molybdenum cofactor biosysynthesis protein [Pelagibacterium sp. SCN 64-44]
MGRVVSVSRDPGHHFSKPLVPEIRLLAGLGVEGDAHAGVTVKHRSRVRVDPTQPNLRQVHLLHRELFDELQAKGFAVSPGDLGENVVVEGIDLLALPVDTELHLGQDAVVRLTGLRNPCAQIENFKKGLLEAVLDRDAEGGLIRKAGVMSVVVTGGVVRVGDSVRVVEPPLPHRAMERV